MRIEILCPEWLTFGEQTTAVYFEKLFPEAEVYRTGFPDALQFPEKKIDLLFFGPMAEPCLEQVVQKLLPYRDCLKAQIEEGMMLLAINNALDVLGKSLTVKNGSPANTLSLFDYETVRDYDHRRSKQTLFEKDGVPFLATILGFSSYYGNEGHELYHALYPASSFHENTALGGFSYRNSWLIECAGCLFLTVPYWTKALRRRFYADDTIPLEAEMTATYQDNLRLLQNMPEYSSFLSALPPSKQE